jgi:hypothetical protein
MKHYVVSAPDPEKCKAIGVKYEGLFDRFKMWLTGVGMGISYISGNHLTVLKVSEPKIRFACDSLTVVNNVKDAWEVCGFSFTEVPS